jgi:hypothetical protein
MTASGLALLVPGRIVSAILPVMKGTEASRSGKVFHVQTVGVIRHDADRPKMKGN